MPRCEHSDRFLDAETHPADLLHKELTAAGGALVVRKDIDDLPVRQDVHQEGLAAERYDGVKIALHLGERPLNGRNFGYMAPAAGHSEISRLSERGPGEDFFEYFQGTSLMGHNFGVYLIPLQHDRLYRNGADVHAHEGRWG